MKLLVTGAFGDLGRAVMAEALRRGHTVTAFDRDTFRTRLLGRRWLRGAGPGGRQLVWGDIRDAATVAEAVEGQDVVFHGAAILAPASERVPRLAEAVNVGGTRHVLQALQGEAARRAALGNGTSPPLVLYPSSVTLYGPGAPDGPLRRPEEPVRPTDGYSRHKAECEALVRDAGLPYVIFRIGVALDPADVRMSGDILRTLLATRPDNRLETIHPRDLAFAVVRAMERPAAWGRTLNLGGGDACRVRQRDLLGVAFGAVGIGAIPDAQLGRAPFYTDWLDTEESERLLEYQRYTFADYARDARHRYRFLRPLVRPAGPLLRWALLRAYGPHGGGRE